MSNTVIIRATELRASFVKATAVRRRGQMKINVNPNWDSGGDRVKIQKHSTSGVRAIRTIQTQGKRDVVILNLRKGRYSALLRAGQNHTTKATSDTIQLIR